MTSSITEMQIILHSIASAGCDYEQRKIIGMPLLLGGIFTLFVGWFLLWGRGFGPEWWRVAIGLPLCFIGVVMFAFGYSHVDPLLIPLNCRYEN